MPIAVHTPNPIENYYAWTEERLRHFSVGVIVVNEQKQVLVNFLNRVHPKYFLPTTTHQPDLSLEETVRKIDDKVGYKLKIERYLGITTDQFPTQSGKQVTKSTIWYSAKVIEQIERDKDYRDADAQILWVDIDKLRLEFENQSAISSNIDQRPALDLL